jgi:predicted negative regulator of RcsB-dependent stress response
LNQLARAETQARRLDNSLGLLRLNAEFHPASAQIPFLQAEVYLQRGDTAAAVAGYRDALAKDSTNGAARRRLAALTH